MLRTDSALVGRSSGNDHSSTAACLVYAHAMTLVGGSYQLVGDLEWEWLQDNP